MYFHILSIIFFYIYIFYLFSLSNDIKKNSIDFFYDYIISIGYIPYLIFLQTIPLFYLYNTDQIYL